MGNLQVTRASGGWLYAQLAGKKSVLHGEVHLGQSREKAIAGDLKESPGICIWGEVRMHGMPPRPFQNRSEIPGMVKAIKARMDELGNTVPLPLLYLALQKLFKRRWGCHWSCFVIFP